MSKETLILELLSTTVYMLTGGYWSYSIVNDLKKKRYFHLGLDIVGASMLVIFIVKMFI